jgi:hypothetical protein
METAVLDPSGHLRIPGAQQAFAEVARSVLAQERSVSQPAVLAQERSVSQPAVLAQERPVSPPAVLFLSYAEEDSGIAAHVVDVLRRRGVNVYDWQENRGTRIIEQMESKLAQATGYLALLSPHFRASAWCRRELELALARDNEITRGAEWPFIYVLAVGQVDPRDAGFIKAYEWVELRDLESLASKLAVLSPPAEAGGQHTEAGDDRARPILNALAFRDRQDELDRVLQGLQSLSGAHFWLVIAPPQFGKSYFIGQIGRLASQHATRPQGVPQSL